MKTIKFAIKRKKDGLFYDGNLHWDNLVNARLFTKRGIKSYLNYHIKRYYFKDVTKYGLSWFNKHDRTYTHHVTAPEEFEIVEIELKECE